MIVEIELSFCLSPFAFAFVFTDLTINAAQSWGDGFIFLPFVISSVCIMAAESVLINYFGVLGVLNRYLFICEMCLRIYPHLQKYINTLYHN